MCTPDFASACRYALRRLEQELPPTLYYHSLAHTRDDVVPATERLAALAGIAGEELLLLRTAAYYHDLGFIEQREEHEAAGARLAAAILPRFGYTPAHIRAIDGLIMATRLPQSPRTPLEALLADADLDVLGRADFLARNRALHAELAALAQPIPDADWYHAQLAFLRGHRYWTAAASTLRDTGKQCNIAALSRLAACHVSGPT
jgi:uncharacterized protein